jgi:CHRD domain
MAMRRLIVAGLGILGAALMAPGVGRTETVHTALDGYQETPFTLSSPGSGEFRAKIQGEGAGAVIEYELTYRDLSSSIVQAHVHLGRPATAGGISFFICTNIGNGPVGTQLSPASPATVTGRITAGDIIGPAGQGITAGEMAEVIRAIRAGATYANVHTTMFPGGEIRGDIGGLPQ